MSKRFLLILGALFVLFIGVIAFTKQDKQTDGNNQAGGSNHVSGKGTSGVTLVEFGDFQCPACGNYYPIVKEIKKKYDDKIAFQFRHYPLVNIHPNAMAAHRAAEAAGNQGKFWQMHDLLYERQQTWSSAGNVSQIFEDYATELGINIDRYKQDVVSSTVADVINTDVSAAQAAGSTSTPTFVLDGKRLETLPNSLEAFTKLIDDAIKQKASS